ncbi:hypothetical protein AB0E04_45485 [Streptomyces sp. NPDC048251]
MSEVIACDHIARAKPRELFETDDGVGIRSNELPELVVRRLEFTA